MVEFSVFVPYDLINAEYFFFQVSIMSSIVEDFERMYSFNAISNKSKGRILVHNMNLFEYLRPFPKVLI
jgi:hypothetical protein